MEFAAVMASAPIRIGAPPGQPRRAGSARRAAPGARSWRDYLVGTRLRGLLFVKAARPSPDRIFFPGRCQTEPEMALDASSVMAHPGGLER